MHAGCAGVFFGGSNQSRAKAAALSRWIDRQQAQINALAARFHIYTGRDPVVILCDEELATRHQIADCIGIDAVALDKKAFHREGVVDKVRKSLAVGRFGDTDTLGMDRGRIHGLI